MKTGIYDMPDVLYFEQDAISNSGLKLMNRSPAHFWQQSVLNPDRIEKESTPAMMEGSMLHKAILEPASFMESYAVLPEDAPRKPTSAQRDAKKPSPATVQAINWWDLWLSGNGDKVIITAERCAEVMMIGDTIRAHPEIGKFTSEGMAEQSVFAKDPETGVLCKIRVDWLCHHIAGMNVMLDYKSSRDARKSSFERDAYNYGYFQGAAFYTDVYYWATGKKIDIYLLPVFEKEPPYAVKLYEVQENEMERGRKAYRESLNLYAQCRELNDWPSYSTEIEPLHYPHWARED